MRGGRRSNEGGWGGGVGCLEVLFIWMGLGKEGFCKEVRIVVFIVFVSLISFLAYHLSII